jgi:hypothetical protein
MLYENQSRRMKDGREVRERYTWEERNNRKG